MSNVNWFGRKPVQVVLSPISIELLESQFSKLITDFFFTDFLTGLNWPTH